MKEYELLFILSPRVPADDVPAAVDRVTALIQNVGGEILNVDSWGRRRLAYPIKHYFEGSYAVVALRMPPTAAAPLEASLIISEEVIRHLLTEGIIPQVNRDRGPSAFEDRDRERAPFGAPALATAGSAAAVAIAEPDTSASAASDTEPAEPAAPAAAEPVAAEPVATEPVATEPVATEPVTAEPVTAEPVTAAAPATEAAVAEAEATDAAAPEAANDSDTAATEPAPAANE